MSLIGKKVIHVCYASYDSILMHEAFPLDDFTMKEVPEKLIAKLNEERERVVENLSKEGVLDKLSPAARNSKLRQIAWVHEKFDDAIDRIKNNPPDQTLVFREDGGQSISYKVELLFF